MLLLSRAARAVRLLAAVTPLDLQGERTRVHAAWAAGQEVSPRWTYAREDMRPVVGLLRAAGFELREWAPSPLRELYAARIDEVAQEALLCGAVGEERFPELARKRFGPVHEGDRRLADALAEQWLSEPRDVDEEEDATTTLSDSREPWSLLGAMRAEVGRLRLPFRVVVEPSLNSLAATGEGVIFIAPHRALGAEAVARTVLHEVHGHAVPRARAARNVEPIFRVGTARGADEQEGYALCLEARTFHLGQTRRRELAGRHLACAWMDAGAEFVEVVRRLIGRAGLPTDLAVRTAERAFRGGDGVHAGLGREGVYLEAFVRIRDHLAHSPDDEATLSAGQVALSAVPTLREKVTR